MKFRYNGDHEKMIAFGYDFSGNKEVDIPDTDERTIDKLTNNSHFDYVHNDKDADAPPVYGVFKKKVDGKPYAKPEQVFEGLDGEAAANNWLTLSGKNQEEYIIMVK